MTLLYSKAMEAFKKDAERQRTSKQQEANLNRRKSK